MFFAEFWMYSFFTCSQTRFLFVLKGHQRSINESLYSFYCWRNIQLNHQFILPLVSKYWSSPPKTHRFFSKTCPHASPYLQRQGSFLFVLRLSHLWWWCVLYDCLPTGWYFRSRKRLRILKITSTVYIDIWYICFFLDISYILPRPLLCVLCIIFPYWDIWPPGRVF